MASPNKPEFQHLLAPGRHSMDVGRLARLCVGPFDTSASRPRLMRSLQTLIDYLERVVGACDVWVDGSFITEKPDPDDIDLTVVVDGEILDRLAATDPAAAEDLLAMAEDGRFSPDLHIFVIAARPIGHPDHPVLNEAARNWSQWWAVTRENWVKGFAVIRLGESDVALRLLP